MLKTILSLGIEMQSSYKYTLKVYIHNIKYITLYQSNLKVGSKTNSSSKDIFQHLY